uniref:acetyl-CoA carboxylase carboxyltransferase beta subunit n=1 Tax=Hydrobryum floribundum TaxID=56908 RepID=UPI0028D61D8F|nr:acetyl-CoA carboxylase carboxyltransferase beta subunit [Hydrobryum floribundum]WMV01550.1 acetyl-CoA carboxylase carboxyltransferase beta subunit [Hydrobryum floribundum]WMV01627.1 acetyl-CoA carboxylase carboxyltransferase beta subunit [Hydrobryum floribundum]
MGDTFKKKILSSSNFLLSCRQTSPGLSFFSFKTQIYHPVGTILIAIENEESDFDSRKITNKESDSDSDYFDNYYFNEILDIAFFNFQRMLDSVSTLSKSHIESLKKIKRYQYLWVTCEVCDGLNYRKDFLSKMYICQYCNSYVRMGSSERIDFLIDSGTWYPMDEDMISLDPIQFDKKNKSDEVKQLNRRSKVYKKYKRYKIKTYWYPIRSTEVLFFLFLELPLSIFLKRSFSISLKRSFSISLKRSFSVRRKRLSRRRNYIYYLHSYLKKMGPKLKKFFFLKENFLKENFSKEKKKKYKKKIYTFKKQKIKYYFLNLVRRNNRQILSESNTILKELKKIISKSIPAENKKALDHKNKKRGVGAETPYRKKIDSVQREHGLTEAVQTGVGMLNGIPVAMGVMDFRFIGGSMGTVVGEKITRLIEYARNERLPLIIVCSSGGARMQEGSLSLMQMAKVSSALHHYQSSNKLFYISVLTSPTTGGVIASFAMLADIIISEPEAHIAFAGKRVIEQTLNHKVPDGSQEAEMIFDCGLLDLIVPRNLLKGVLNELVHLHI